MCTRWRGTVVAAGGSGGGEYIPRMRLIASTTSSSNSPPSRVMRPNSWTVPFSLARTLRRGADADADALRAACSAQHTHLAAVDVQRDWELWARCTKIEKTSTSAYIVHTTRSVTRGRGRPCSGELLTDALPLAVLDIRRIVGLRVGELPAELLVEREEGHLAALESLPCSMRAAARAAGRHEPCPSRAREGGREHSHRTVDVIVGDPVLPLVRRNRDEWAATDNTADLWYSMAEQQKRQQRSATGGELGELDAEGTHTSNITALRCGEVMSVCRMYVPGRELCLLSTTNSRLRSRGVKPVLLAWQARVVRLRPRGRDDDPRGLL